LGMWFLTFSLLGLAISEETNEIKLKTETEIERRRGIETLYYFLQHKLIYTNGTTCLFIYSIRYLTIKLKKCIWGYLIEKQVLFLQDMQLVLFYNIWIF
jgi:hypothetical protein